MKEGMRGYLLEMEQINTMVSSHLGTLLVETGKLTLEQLKAALKLQEENKKKGILARLGHTLVELDYCTEETIGRTIAQQLGIDFVTLESYPVDSSAQMLIEPENARRYQALPLGFDNDRLVMAMLQPMDVIAIDDLRILTGYEIKPVIAPDSELKAAIEQFSRGATNIDQAEAEEEQSDAEVISDDRSTEKPAVQLANLIFNQSVKAGASDVHIEPQEKSLRVRFRIDGVLHETLQPPKRLHPSLVSRIKVMANMDIAERRVPQDGRITLRVEGKTVDVRVASLPSAYGEKLTLRLLNRSARLITLEEMGFPSEYLHKYKKIMRLPYGFILVTGPTGSGKSTTLYATLAELNTVEKHIITVEDPIEYRMDGINQVQVNPRAGLTFATGLRSILRNDPDIIMIGEIRDHETARIAVESALTGHLVLSTLHTNDAAGAIGRLGDMGIEAYLTSSSLVGILAQRLTRLLCSHCKTPYKFSSSEILANVPDFPLAPGETTVTLYKPAGCLRCNNTGYKGRKGIYELLLMSETIRRLALEHSSAQQIKEAAMSEGMITLRQDGLQKAKSGITSLEEIMRVVV